MRDGNETKKKTTKRREGSVPRRDLGDGDGAGRRAEPRASALASERLRCGGSVRCAAAGPRCTSARSAEAPFAGSLRPPACLLAGGVVVRALVASFGARGVVARGGAQVARGVAVRRAVVVAIGAAAPRDDGACGDGLGAAAASATLTASASDTRRRGTGRPSTGKAPR